MKKILLILVLIIALDMNAQVVFKGQINVSDVELSVQGTLLRVKMRVSYEKNLLNRGETLNFTPVLKNDSYQKALSSVVITGKGENTNRQRGNFPIVRRSNTEGSYFFDYDTTVPYQSWMNNSSLYVESEERSSKGKGHVYEDCVFTHLTIDGAKDSSKADDPVYTQTATAVNPSSTRKSSSSTSGNNAFAPLYAQTDWIQIVDPSKRRADEINFTGKIDLADSRHIGSMSTHKFNKTIADEILNHIGDVLSVPGTSIASLSVTGYGAPIGDYRSNETRSIARAYELKRYLMSGNRISSNLVNVAWVTEDWDSIATLIGNSELRFRNAALDIINNVDVPSGREEQLAMLGNGTLYKDLQNEIFPHVCRLNYDVKLRRENTAGVVHSSRAVTLSSLYATAQHFEKGSDDFNDIIDLAARLFPNNPDACINAAGVALLRGDTKKAERYLQGLEADQRAYNNMGVLYLLKGDTAKAETYLRMARKLGVPEATKAMSALK